MRAETPSRVYSSAGGCHWGLRGKDWIRDPKNGSCYQYAEWDMFTLSDCDNVVRAQWQKDEKNKTVKIVASVVGSLVGLLLIFSAVYWRRQKKSERMRRHGKVEEVQSIELEQHVKP